MQVVCIDSNIVLAARNANAKRHDDATAIFNAIDTGELPRARLINYVVPEILHPLQKRISKAAAFETLDRLQSSRGFELVYVSKTVHLYGEQLFRTYEALSGSEWVDSILTAYMHSEDIGYIYSFDDDFDVSDDVTRLTTAINPFKPD
ncbi:type II toxin-antitoxin system VapC family toxin [Haloquadratum walsbyi]|jgi:Predicted nucleic acid-binding protein, contains PIN domain|uniref:Putative nucleic acid-binding protein, contains PIN domain protein n=1 Tax=Haloquadratum walsbyi J07HQW2 TaxID=1238425 RepID=U1NG38_9EURY|nr:PIN domain-containing protein [Haloquadratum walsbyi]ERG96075.1 MAG: putative nucleic acid-binding protein, contains PIN domain protein [Haloquadratum walsbyi J07HQW2]